MIIDENNINDFLYDGDKRLSCFNGNLTEIKYIPSCVEIIWIDGNKLTSLPELPESVLYVDCRWNPNLPYAGEYRNPKEMNELRKRINMDLYLKGEI